MFQRVRERARLSVREPSLPCGLALAVCGEGRRMKQELTTVKRSTKREFWTPVEVRRDDRRRHHGA